MRGCGGKERMISADREVDLNEKEQNREQRGRPGSREGVLKESPLTEVKVKYEPAW